jgi:hypothetical protein
MLVTNTSSGTVCLPMCAQTLDETLAEVTVRGQHWATEFSESDRQKIGFRQDRNPSN